MSNAKAQSSNEVQNPNELKNKLFDIETFVIDLTEMCPASPAL